MDGTPCVCSHVELLRAQVYGIGMSVVDVHRRRADHALLHGSAQAVTDAQNELARVLDVDVDDEEGVGSLL